MDNHRQKALEAFTDYFVRNYPGPNPKLHVLKIFGAAEYAIKTNPPEEEQPAPDHAGLVEALRQRARCRENYFLPENETLEWQAAEAIAALSRAPEPVAWALEKRPTAFLVKNQRDGEDLLFFDEQAASDAADMIGAEYDGLYLRKPFTPHSYLTLNELRSLATPPAPQQGEERK